MKKFLSLVLALVMTMSLVTVSAGAKDFTDSSKINYSEAVDVMSAAKVIDGYADGTFNPSATLTRGAAAKIICNLILGPTTASALVADAAPYSDVPTTHTFAGYIAYCQKTGIISGYADGTFKPANTLTGYAFMKMLLGALGYNASTEGYTGANWSINVAKRAINAGLNDGLKTSFNGVKAVTREEACLYAFNTLKATMVEYENDSTITVNGVTFTNKSTAKEMENTAKVETIKDDNKMQFAEKYFDKLVKKDTTDDFGRPAAEWTYDKNKVGTYVDYTTLVQEFTTKVTYKDLYDTIGSSNLKNNDFVSYFDGVKGTGKDINVSSWTKTDKNTFGTDTKVETGNGVLTQVFVDNDKDLVTVAVINTYLAKATSDYSTKNDKVSLEVYGIKTDSDGQYVRNEGTSGTTKTISVYGEDVAAAESLKEDDIVLVTVANKEIKTIASAETVKDTAINNFKKTDYLTAGGTKYEYAKSATYKTDVLDAYDDNNMKDTTYNVYLDQYGYAIGVEVVDGNDNYVFVAAYENYKSILSDAKTDATAIFTDGTSKNITVKVESKLNWNPDGKPLENTWYTYTTDKNGVYTLKKVADEIATGVKTAQGHDDTDGKKIDKSHVTLTVGSNTHVYGNDDTVYIDAKVKNVNASGVAKQITGVTSVYTGVKNIKAELVPAVVNAQDSTKNEAGGAYVLYKDNGYIIAAVIRADKLSSSDNYVFVTDTVSYEGYDKDADEYTWSVEGIRNGEKVTLTEKGDSLDVLEDFKTDANTNQFYKFYYDADGNVMDKDPIVFVSDAAAQNNKTTAVKYVSHFNDETSGTNYDKEDVELLWQPMDTNYKLKMVGHTLYVKDTGAKDYGIDIAPDAKAVLKDKLDGKKYTEYFDSETGNVKAAIDELENASFNGNLYAVMKDGVAVSIIIIDDDPHTGNKVDGKPTGVTGWTGTVDVDGRSVTVKSSSDLAGNEGKCASAAVAALYDAGYEVTKQNTSVSPWVFTAKNIKTGTDGIEFSVNFVKA